MCTEVDYPIIPSRRRTPVSNSRYLLGMAVASIFSLAYLLVPAYIISAIFALVMRYPDTQSSLAYALPMLFSLLFPPKSSRFALWMARPMLDYFVFESLHLSDDVDETETETCESMSESSDDEGNMRCGKEESSGGEEKSSRKRRGRILAAQPHGVLTYVAMCEAITNPESAERIPTAVASILLRTPILRNLMGIFNLVDASGPSLKRHLGADGGSVLLYVGGIAELFKSCRNEERLYLKERKGFIKLALTCNVDVVPVYLFGNTSVLSVLRRGPLAGLSRRLGASLTLFWGKYYLPIPRDEKVRFTMHLAPPCAISITLLPSFAFFDRASLFFIWRES